MEISSRSQPHERSRSLFNRHNANGASDPVKDDAKQKNPSTFQSSASKSDQDGNFRKPTLPATAMKSKQDRDTAFPKRQSSISKDSRYTAGVRPLDGSASIFPKRVFSDRSREVQVTQLPSTSSMPSLDRPLKGSGKPRFSFGQSQIPDRKSSSNNGNAAVNLESPQSYAFLPPVSFDDFQTSIAGYDRADDTSFRSFPLSATDDDFTTNILDDDMNVFTTPTQATRRGIATRRIKEMSSTSQNEPLFARRDVLRKPAADKTPSNIKPATNPARARKPFELPSSSSFQALPTIGVTSPQKSAGPARLTTSTSRRRLLDDEAVLNLPLAPVRPDDRNSPTAKTRRRPAADSGNESVSSSATAQTRSSRAKATAPPVRQSSMRQRQADPATPASSQLRARSTSRPATTRQTLVASTPTSSAKRQSGRMSGLGARTVSPTDARRKQRMSMMPVLPRPTLPLEPSPGSRSTVASPSLIPRKPSLTLSSARDTPDSNVQYHTSTSSLSRSSSFQSLRANTAPTIPAVGTSPSLSRLPLPRVRNVYSSADIQDDELVPPVPAIPKAYESPKDQIDTPFFSGGKASSSDLGSTHSWTPRAQQLPHSTSSSLATGSRKASFGANDAPYSRLQSSMTGLSLEEQKSTIPDVPMIKKKPLQPVRLPPLSLQPLSTPTATRIAALPHPSHEVDARRSTPSPNRLKVKTPSTPMTASKAMSFQAPKSYGNLRSSTSHHALRPNAVEHNSLDQFSEQMPMQIPSSKQRQITPFTSGSLPRASSEYMSLDKILPNDYTLSQQEVRIHSAKPMGPRPRAVSKPVKDDPSPQPLSAFDDIAIPPSSSSLRRKFSLTWKRSASKSAIRGQMDHLDPGAANVPTPKVPAEYQSIDNNHALDITPPDSTRSSLDANKRKQNRPVDNSANGLTGTDDSAAGSNKLAYRSLHSNLAQSHAVTPRSSSWSISSQSKMRTATLTSTVSQSDLKRAKVISSALLDKDDLAADDEMKRLALKRKGVEAAARLTDELQKRATFKSRMTPAQAIQSSSGVLNIYEKGEIIDYKEGVYFCGTKTARKHVGDIAAAGTTNFGYDDERGDYNICIGDHLAYRYEVVDILGKGSFGQVVRCIDHKQGALVAVKIIRNKKRFHQQALVEVNILNKLRDWDPQGTHATLTVTSSFYFRSHLCIVTPCLSINLYELIKEHQFQGFSLQLIRRFARQLLSCLQLLQSKSIIHCDLKPENILLCDPRRADVRVIDFGSSCKTDEKVYTYIQSRFYRSPEVILGSEYGLGIDMWSFGCILAELFTGYPIFPGENEQEQLACIMEIFGPPPRDIIEKCSRRKLFFDSAGKPRVIVSSKGRRRRPSSKSLNMSLKCDDEAFIDFLTQCLRWDPDRRMRPDQAVSHPFILNEVMKKPTAEKPRVRPNATISKPAPSTASSVSPTKRIPIQAPATAPAQTPSKETRGRALPQTPSTAIRGASLSASRLPDCANKSSPVRAAVLTRRQSTTQRQATGPEVTASNKRLSNGFALGSSIGSTASIPASGGTSGLPRLSSGRVASGGHNVGTTTIGSASKIDLAGAAARESMGVGNVSASRWR